MVRLLPSSFTVSTASGMLLSGYHSAAVLSRCELVRVDDVLNQTTSTFSALVDWSDEFWVTQPVSLVLHFPRADWEWRDAKMSGHFVKGTTITGVVRGDPVVTKVGG